MARRVWSDAEIERLRQGYLRLEPTASIAADLGRPANQIRLKAHALGLASKHRMAVMASLRMREVFADPASDHAAKLMAASSAPEALARRKASIQRAYRCPGLRARVAHQRRVEADAKRGFTVPARQWAAYQRLLLKDFTPREAGEILGLIPRSIPVLTQGA